MWDDEVDDLLLAALWLGYVRRQKWLARLHAAEMGRVLVAVLGGRDVAKGVEVARPGQQVVGTSGKRYSVLGAEAMLGMVG